DPALAAAGRALSPGGAALYLQFRKEPRPRVTPVGLQGGKRGCVMGMQCAVCGKKPVLGNQYARRGKAKYLGGVGRKVTGISRRKFKPNLQNIRVQVGGG